MTRIGESFGESLAAVAAKVRGLASAQAQANPDARVRLARALEAPPMARVDALLGLEPGFIGGAEPKPPYAGTLGAFQEQISGCLRCPLGAKRKNVVFGEGNASAPLAFVGSAPGGDEDLMGRPFQGASGELLERMCAAMGYKRGELYICDVVKCRPAARNPESGDIAACGGYLEHQLGLLGPKAVVALGEVAAQFLLGSAEPLASLRGRWGVFRGLKVMPTYHPADLLRDPGLKRHVWDDMKRVMQELKKP